MAGALRIHTVKAVWGTGFRSVTRDCTQAQGDLSESPAGAVGGAAAGACPLGHVHHLVWGARERDVSGGNWMRNH